jgi:RNA polymerase sigma-70 factor (ECF subfamily)
MESTDEADARPSQARRLEAKDRLALVEAALDRLNGEQREAIILARFHDLGHREIAEILGCTEGSVKARVFRGLQALTRLVDGMERPS